MVDSWYCLGRVVLERMRQVSKRSKVGNHKRHTLNTRLSSGTSAHTSSRSRNAPGRMVWSDLFLTRINLKWNRPIVKRSFWIIFFEGSGPPLIKTAWGVGNTSSRTDFWNKNRVIFLGEFFRERNFLHRRWFEPSFWTKFSVDYKRFDRLHKNQ